jgi:hypothetical protein
MKLKVILLLILMTSMVGCISIPDTDTMLKTMFNVPSSGESKFDGTKYIRLSKMQCNSVMFELYQDTRKSQKGIVLLMAGSNTITNIGDGQSLHVKLDGKTYSFQSNDSITEHETISMGYGATRSFSHKTYIVPESFVRAAATSSIFLTKVHLLNNTFIEGTCSTTTLEEARNENKDLGIKLTQEHIDTSNKITAINGFRDFVKLMDTLK